MSNASKVELNDEQHRLIDSVLRSFLVVTSSVLRSREFSTLPWKDTLLELQGAFVTHAAGLSISRSSHADFNVPELDEVGIVQQCMDAIDSIVTAAIAAASQKGSETTPL